MGKIKGIASIIVFSLSLIILEWLLSVLIIRNIGNVLYLLNEEQFGEIFSQLKNNSSIIPPFIIPFLIVTFIMILLFKNQKKVKPLRVIILFLVMIIMQVLSILLSNVNGIYFIDIIISLINNMGGLGLWRKLINF